MQYVKSSLGNSLPQYIKSSLGGAAFWGQYFGEQFPWDSSLGAAFLGQLTIIYKELSGGQFLGLGGGAALGAAAP
jgi:hypothetical protein